MIWVRLLLALFKMPITDHLKLNLTCTFRYSTAKWLVVLLVFLVGCSSQPTRSIPSPPPDVLSIPDPTPKPVTRSALGNPAFYEVFGKRYFVLTSSDGFVERGVASWYGPGFHKERTATGDPYDMYSMTAAHKTLPLPCYARVTNLRNGHSVVVYINDRGPFKDGRIVDLSYTAAAKLDMLRDGTALVELRVVDADGNDTQVTPAQSDAAPLYVQAGAFKEEANAQKLIERIQQVGIANVFLRRDVRSLFRVRIGPIADAGEFDRIVSQLKSMGIQEARLAPAE
jgi:rare lipoprotein A